MRNILLYAVSFTILLYSCKKNNGGDNNDDGDDQDAITGRYIITTPLLTSYDQKMLYYERLESTANGYIPAPAYSSTPGLVATNDTTLSWTIEKWGNNQYTISKKGYTINSEDIVYWTVGAERNNTMYSIIDQPLELRYKSKLSNGKPGTEQMFRIEKMEGSADSYIISPFSDSPLAFPVGTSIKNGKTIGYYLMGASFSRNWPDEGVCNLGKEFDFNGDSILYCFTKGILMRKL